MQRIAGTPVFGYDGQSVYGGQLKAGVLADGKVSLIAPFSCDRLQNQVLAAQKGGREGLEAAAPC